MANEVTIHVKADTAEASIKLKLLEEEAKHEGEKAGKSFSDKFKSAMSSIGKAGDNPFANIGAMVGGAGLLGGPLAGLGLSVGAFAAVAVPELTKVQTALSKTGTAGQKAWAALTPGERTLAGDLKNLSSSFHGVQKALQPVIDHVFSLGAKIGVHLMPALEKLGRAGGKILEVFLKALDKLVQSKSFDNFINAMVKFGKEAAKSLTPALMHAVEGIMKSFTDNSGTAMKVIDALSKLITFIGEHATGIMQAALAFKALTMAVKLFNLASTIMEASNPLLLAITAVVIVVLLLITHWHTVQKVAKEVWAKIKEYVGDAMKFVKRIIGDVVDWVKSHWQLLLAILTGPIGLAVLFIKDHFHTIMSWVGKVIHAIGHGFSEAYHFIVDPISAAINAVIGFFKKLWSYAGGIINTIKSGLGGVGSFLGGLFATGGTVGAAATGGVRSNMVMVGEHGREIVQLPTGSRVHSNPDTERMMAGGSSGGEVTVVFDFGGQASDELVKWLRKSIRVRGGNVQTVLGH